MGERGTIIEFRTDSVSRHLAAVTSPRGPSLSSPPASPQRGTATSASGSDQAVMSALANSRQGRSAEFLLWLLLAFLVMRRQQAGVSPQHGGGGQQAGVSPQHGGGGQQAGASPAAAIDGLGQRMVAQQVAQLMREQIRGNFNHVPQNLQNPQNNPQAEGGKNAEGKAPAGRGEFDWYKENAGKDAPANVRNAYYDVKGAYKDEGKELEPPGKGEKFADWMNKEVGQKHATDARLALSNLKKAYEAENKPKEDANNKPEAPKAEAQKPQAKADVEEGKKSTRPSGTEQQSDAREVPNAGSPTGMETSSENQVAEAGTPESSASGVQT